MFLKTTVGERECPEHRAEVVVCAAQRAESLLYNSCP